MATLRRTISLQITSLILCLLLVGAAALWGLEGLRSDFGAALAGYQQLRDLYEVGMHVQAARRLVAERPPSTQPAAAELRAAMDLFDLQVAPAGADSPVVAHARAALLAAIQTPDDPGRIDAVLGPLADLDAAHRQAIQAAQQRADAKRETTILGMVVLLAAAAAGAVVIGIAQYRAVLRPLASLNQAVQRIAAGRFADRVPVAGSAEFAEFAELAGNFNRMAAELQELYGNLQAKVDAKSRELAQSRQLASLGFMAAGVAHEINNPLGIMTAHAELATAAVRRGDPTAMEECQRAMRVICDEAYRCKAIVRKLLSLTRGPTEEPRVLPLGSFVREAIAEIAAMPACRDRILTVAADPADGHDLILASPDELRQVLLNLLLNAIEATEPGGQVRVMVECADKNVELSVADNGRGIAADSLERIFEPFYTDPRGKSADARGTGLGLAIAQAIVHRHAGELRAASAGPGQGSRFVASFPLAKASA